MAFQKPGGGGIASDEVNATKANVLAGKTALTSDSNDEVGTGTLPLASVLASYGGTIPSYSDSSSVALGTPGASKSYPSGYYPNAHGAYVNISWYTDLS